MLIIAQEWSLSLTFIQSISTNAAKPPLITKKNGIPISETFGSHPHLIRQSVGGLVANENCDEGSDIRKVHDTILIAIRFFKKIS